MRTFFSSALLATTLVTGITYLGAPPVGAAEYECQGRPATVVGTGGSDWIVVDHTDAVVVLLGGDDTVFLAGGDGNFVCGGGGDDWIVGASGDDNVYGEGGDDTIFGMDGDDLIIGGDGEDELYGNGDSDSIFGGSGFDHIDGGQGGSGPGDYCEDMSGAVVGANFYNCEAYGTYLAGRPVDGLPGTANPFVLEAPGAGASRQLGGHRATVGYVAG